MLNSSIFSRSLASLSSILRSALSEKGFILLSCVVVGVLAGTAAVALKSFCDLCHSLSMHCAGAWGAWGFWLIPALPAIGIMLCVLFVKFAVKGRYDKSLSSVIAATAKGTSDIHFGKMYSHIVTSGVSVGLGGSAGLEAPIALTGSALGSNAAKAIGLGGESRTLLLACGGAAGIAAIFNSPVGGTLFACEVLLPEFSVPALVPLLMSAATATVVSSVLYSNQPFIALSEGWRLDALPFYVLLGAFCGLVSAYLIRSSSWAGGRIGKFGNVWTRALAGGAILYLAFLLMPSLRGEGYSSIAAIVSGDCLSLFKGSPFEALSGQAWTLVALLGALILLKGALSAVTIESGGDGGIFAPSMYTGAFAGLFLARAVNLSGVFVLNEVNFIAVGMGGVLAGVMHAPMTGIFLIAEITGGYKLFIPLMIVAALSCFICKRFEPFNVYKKPLMASGLSLGSNPDTAAVEATSLRDLVERDYMAVKEDDTLRSLIRTAMASKRNIFPVVDAKGSLKGIVTLDNLRPFLLDSQLYDVALVYDIMSPPGPSLSESDSLADAARLFEKSSLWNIPVSKDGAYLGFVSKAGVFDRYRQKLRDKPELF